MFDLGGTIEVGDPLNISFDSVTDLAGGDVYIAGQSAPSDSGGIQLKLAATNDSTSPIQIQQADHVLLRHLRIRPGPGQVVSASVSGIGVRNGRHLMFDNLSIMYATDQNFSVAASRFNGLAPLIGETRYFTLQDSIVAWALHNANHPEGTHSKGALICNVGTGAFSNGDRCGYGSLINNYFAHNNDRNPEWQASGGPAEIINNIFFNYASDVIELLPVNEQMEANIISNAAVEGVNTNNTVEPYSIECSDVFADECDVYLYGNINEDRRAASNAGAEGDVIDPTVPSNIATAPFDSEWGGTIKAEDLAAVLLPIVGATAPSRDALDVIVVACCDEPDVGARIDDPTEITGAGITDGYPTLATGTAPTDTDDDGMPDTWEAAFPDGLSDIFDAWGDRNGDGWSNLEEYLNFLAGDIPDPRP